MWRLYSCSFHGNIAILKALRDYDIHSDVAVLKATRRLGFHSDVVELTVSCSYSIHDLL